MTPHHSPHSPVHERIIANPKFQRLARQRAILAWSLSALVLAIYYLFIVLVAFVPGWLHLPLYEGSHLSRGIPLGAAIIIFCWLLTAWYVRHANTRFDALSAEILEENHA
ncbi:DUF485 domain-containing protein [Metapseudomonas furukawaii]|uniref:Membrane protein n=1 Tax=Metapseudomonas furukawaii TaxID=1149133 RepID=A0AAD1FG24_METFU|nr:MULTISPECIES: DUF485 domain-containing protein [Pseudomonas]ELS25894.1 Putative membrane protein, clustering with ActP [Pseudomonas furukawaii]OWJ93443.1 hypothetical protein B6S59_17140 [Pseudomonas sp. A46]WAG76762.1 DUF485 domain-containing protein [Pseudomonas furukawaii]BAU74712.1 putative membrane protein [Pseudomonas furukawaii]